MPYSTSTDLLVLHTLRCVGFVSLARLSEATGLPADDVESELIDLAVAGQVTHLPGDFGGWGITDTGKAVDLERTSAELDAAGARTATAKALDDFLVLNPELLDLCAAWQLSDHDDSAYDGRVLGAFLDLDQRVDPICAALAAALERFARYRARFDSALARAKAGELEFLADSTSSYHAIWFQLHEDLLSTLGIPRT
ncbi:hypothetical protein [Tenggerimyces flavus]|uniref:Transcriptional regulator n=1 Tax=Tenggerimyces flavus TaxID=1708749 RepID=A0ABV7YI41_9ACTN|nr:hypothetical protein [Tenggerimyces flavus]MBM7784694.1 hypothetical protein [Tenggerimyces flavus]